MRTWSERTCDSPRRSPSTTKQTYVGAKRLAMEKSAEGIVLGRMPRKAKTDKPQSQTKGKPQTGTEIIQCNELTSRDTDGYPKGRSSSTTVATEDGTRLQINEFTELKA